MPELKSIGIGALIFLIGAVIYIVNLILNWSKKGRTIGVDGVGLMVLGLGIAMLLKL